MENEGEQSEQLSMYDRNMLQHDIAERIGAQLGISVEDVLLEHHTDLSEIIDSDPEIVRSLREDRDALIDQIAATLLDRHQERSAA